MEIDAWIDGCQVRSFPWIDGKRIYVYDGKLHFKAEYSTRNGNHNNCTTKPNAI